MSVCLYMILFRSTIIAEDYLLHVIFPAVYEYRRTQFRRAGLEDL